MQDGKRMGRDSGAHLCLATPAPLPRAKPQLQILHMTDSIRFLIGVDGGGTSCRAAVARLDGTIIGRGESGSSNITTNLDGATDNILSAVRAALSAAGLHEDVLQHSAAVLGLAGANVGDFATRLSERLPFARQEIESDATIALQGALADGDGTIAILGTGSAFLSRKGETLRLIGGWGFQLSDLGGGARLGRDLLERAILAHDGVAKQTALTDEILGQFERGPEGIVLFAQTAKPADYGRFAPLVLRQLGAGDETAKQLFSAAAKTVDAAFDTLCMDGIDRIALLGGLARFYPDYLAERHRRRLVPPIADALTGAVELAAKLAANGAHGAGRATR
jgi:glucosamine kinase